MATPISKAEWDQMVADHGEQEAGQLAQEDGLFLANDDGTPYQPDDQELAAVPSDPQAGYGAPSGSPLDPAQAQFAVRPGDQQGAPQQSLAVQPGAQQPQADQTLAAKPGAQQTGAPTPLQQQQLGLAQALAQSRASISQIYDNAAKKMADMYKGPSTGELLMQAGTALMQPTESGRFGDALANAAKTVPAWFKERRETGNELGKSQIALDLQRATTLAGLEEKGLAAAGKSPNASKRIDPTTGLVIDLDNLGPTGAKVTLKDGHVLFPWQDGTFHAPKDPETGVSDVYQKIGGEYHLVSQAQGDP